MIPSYIFMQVCDQWSTFIKLDNFVIVHLKLQGFSTWQRILACVTMQALFLMRWLDWAPDCTILLHTKTHTIAFEDSVYTMPYPSHIYTAVLQSSGISTLSSISTIAMQDHHSSYYLLVLQHGVIFLAICVMMSHASGLVVWTKAMSHCRHKPCGICNIMQSGQAVGMATY